MTESTLTPEQCEKHAQECRDLAEQDPQRREKFIELALIWEHICEDLKVYDKLKSLALC
jgi:hypothetical protein